MRDFRNLLVWVKSHALALDVYEVTQGFPQSELYGLTSQLRRSAASIPTNIVEGFGRDTIKELARFCQIAMGSASETAYLLILCHDLNYHNDEQFTHLSNNIDEIQRMLRGFITKLRANS